MSEFFGLQMNLAVALGIAFGITILSVVVNHYLCKKSRRERDEAVREKMATEQRSREMRDERLNVEERALAIWEKNLDYEAERRTLVKGHAALSAHVEELEKEKTRLRKKCDEVREKFKQEKESNRTLEREIKELQENIDRLEEEIRLKKQIIFEILSMLQNWKKDQEIKTLQWKIRQLEDLIKSRVKCDIQNDIALIKEMQSITGSKVIRPIGNHQPKERQLAFERDS